VNIAGDGTTLIIAKLHPFSPEGVSLYGNSEIESHLKASSDRIVEEILLMFTNSPEDISYEVLTKFSKNDNQIVLCDVGNTGKLSKMKGAYIIEVLVYLNTSSFLRKISRDLYEVTIRDSYTCRDPRSWIDVLLVKFSNGATLVNYTWLPASAHGPLKKTSTSLLWVNYNELQAPDYYIFYVKLPKLKLALKPMLSGKIVNVLRTPTGIKVTVENNSSISGYFYLRVLANSMEQTVKVYTKAGGRTEIEIPLTGISEKEITIELLSGNTVVDKNKISIEGLKVFKKKLSKPTSLQIFKIVSIVVIIVGAIIVVYGILYKPKEKVVYTPYYEYPSSSWTEY